MNMPQGRINLNDAIIRNKKKKELEKEEEEKKERKRKNVLWFAIGLLTVSLTSLILSVC